MVISSRTPEGESNPCPICNHRVVLEPSIDTRDAPCPYCGHLLWFDEYSAVDQSAKAVGVTWVEAVLQIGTKLLGPPSPADRQAVIEALEKLGEKPDAVLGSADEWLNAMRHLGKFALVVVFEKTLTAPSWRALAESLVKQK